MKTQLKKVALLPVVLAPLLAGCLAHSGSKAVPANVKAYAARVPQVDGDVSNSCWQLRQIAKQKAFLQSTIEDKEKTFDIPSKCGKPKSKKKAKTRNEAA